MVVGGAAAATAGCAEPTPAVLASCPAGVLAGGTTVAGGFFILHEAGAMFRNETLPAIKNWGCKTE